MRESASVDHIGVLSREIKVLVFDLYGTIVDMQKDLTEAATPFLKEKGWAGDPHRFVTWWRRAHFENSMIDALCDKGHTPYRQIGHRAVSYVMDRSGISCTQEDVRWLISRIEVLKPFPEIVEAYRTSGEVDYMLRVVAPDMETYDLFYKKLVEEVDLYDVRSHFVMEEMKKTTALPLQYC